MTYEDTQALNNLIDTYSVAEVLFRTAQLCGDRTGTEWKDARNRIIVVAHGLCQPEADKRAQ
jgi:hypothetical protein